MSPQQQEKGNLRGLTHLLLHLFGVKGARDIWKVFSYDRPWLLGNPLEFLIIWIISSETNGLQFHFLRSQELNSYSFSLSKGSWRINRLLDLLGSVRLLVVSLSFPFHSETDKEQWQERWQELNESTNLPAFTHRILSLYLDKLIIISLVIYWLLLLFQPYSWGKSWSLKSCCLQSCDRILFPGVDKGVRTTFPSSMSPLGNGIHKSSSISSWIITLLTISSLWIKRGKESSIRCYSLVVKKSSQGINRP